MAHVTEWVVVVVLVLVLVLVVVLVVVVVVVVVLLLLAVVGECLRLKHKKQRSGGDVVSCFQSLFLAALIQTCADICQLMS